jgi:hypothetical protein
LEASGELAVLQRSHFLVSGIKFLKPNKNHPMRKHNFTLPFGDLVLGSGSTKLQRSHFLVSGIKFLHRGCASFISRFIMLVRRHFLVWESGFGIGISNAPAQPFSGVGDQVVTSELCKFYIRVYNARPQAFSGLGIWFWDRVLQCSSATIFWRRGSSFYIEVVQVLYQGYARFLEASGSSWEHL